jgi:glycosyltransferase involved in cell wall biosynthesis
MEHPLNDFDIYIVYKRIGHHSKHSGYDQLLKHVSPSTRIISASETGYFFKMAHRIVGRFTGNKWYGPDSLKMESEVLIKRPITKRSIYHFIYGEDNFRYSTLCKRARERNKILCTFHQPPGVFKSIVENKNFLKTLDAVIVVGTSQLSYFQNFLGKGDVHFIPHGVDTDFFSPSINDIQTKKGNKVCLFVGQWLRDFRCLINVSKIISKANRNVIFEVITTEKGKKNLIGLNNLNVKSNISDEELLGSYQKADLFVLPLTDCTANNSILEAISAGLPVVTTSVGGVKDYVDRSSGFLTQKGDAEAMAERIMFLLDNDDERKKMGRAARARAVNEFDWQIVANKLKRLYQKIMRSRSA